MTQLTPRRFHQDAEYVRTVHVIIPELDTPIEALLEPGYWAHVSQYLKPWDRIEVQAEDGSYYAELIVKASGKLYAKVELLTRHDLVAVIPGAMDLTPSGYHVRWRGTFLKWCVLRDGTTDGGGIVPAKDTIREGFDTEAEARNWLGSFLKSLPPDKKAIPAPTPVNKTADTTL